MIRAEHRVTGFTSNNQKPEVTLTDVEISPKTSMTSLNTVASKQSLASPILKPTVTKGNRNDNASCVHELIRMGSENISQTNQVATDNANGNWAHLPSVNMTVTPSLGSHQQSNNDDNTHYPWKPKGRVHANADETSTRQPATKKPRKSTRTRKHKIASVEHV